MAPLTLGECIDVLNLLSDHVNNKGLLYNLCLVSQQFNYVFSARLWRCLEFDDLNMHCFTDDEKRAALLQTTNLRYTQILIHKMAYQEDCDERRVFPKWTAELSELVQKLPNLESIAAHELDMSRDIMLALSCAPCLKSLVLHFTENIEFSLLLQENPDLDPQDVDTDAGFWHDRPCRRLPLFQHLSRLTLLNIFGDLRYWSKWIVKLLLRNPNLEHLSLSISTFTRYAIADGVGRAYHRDYPVSTFFTDLCVKYSKKSDQQMKLRSLRLDEHIEFPDLPTLSKLTNTAYLEDIHMFINDYGNESTVALDILPADATPSLSRLSVTTATNNFLEVIRERLFSSTRRLSILSVGHLASRRPLLYQLLHASAPSVNLFGLYYPAEMPHLRGNSNIRQLGVSLRGGVLGDQINAGEDFMTLCDLLGTMPSLEALWLMESIKAKSHNSITAIQAHNLRFVLPNLAAACCRLHYVKIGGMAWRIHPKVRHAKQQMCTFEELDRWEAALEGPAAFGNPQPIGQDVAHEDW